MADIKKEVPAWVINWVNKVFTLLNTPNQIDDIFVDGTIYLDFILSGNILTLSDAPTVSIDVDYSYGTIVVPVTSDVNFGDIKSKVWNLLGQSPNSTTFSATVVGDAINAEMKHIIHGRITSKLDPNRIYRVGKLWFMEGKLSVRKMAWSSLTVNYNVGDTTITCATGDLLGAGYVEIGWETINYTSKSSTQLLGVSGATIDHLETEAIAQLYDTPVEMDRPQSVQLIIKGQNIKKVELPLNNGDTALAYYQIVRTSTKQLLKIVGVESSSVIEIKYQKKVANLSADSDINILPEDYGITVLAYLVAGQFAFEKGMPNAQSILLSGYSALQNMYWELGNETIITKQKLTPVAYSNFR